MNQQQRKLLRLAGICGIMGPVAGLVSILLAIHYSPWFSWTENYLSDLGGDWGESGIWTSRGNAGIIFNAGIVFTGLSGMAFSASIIRSGVIENETGIRGMKLLLVSMVGLMCVGIFPETTGPLHILSALTFFLLSPVALIVTGRALSRTTGESFARMVLALATLSLILLPVILLPRPCGRNAVAEALTTIPVAVCIFITGVGMLRKKAAREERD